MLAKRRQPTLANLNVATTGRSQQPQERSPMQPKSGAHVASDPGQDHTPRGCKITPFSTPRRSTRQCSLSPATPEKIQSSPLFPLWEAETLQALLKPSPQPNAIQMTSSTMTWRSTNTSRSQACKASCFSPRELIRTERQFNGVWHTPGHRL